MSTYSNRASLSGTLSSTIVGRGTSDYNELENLPTINGVLVKGDLTTKDLGIERGYDASVDPADDEHLILTT